MIVIVDYEMGNLQSVHKALLHFGSTATVSNDPAVIAQASKLIVPGVGAFRDAIGQLRQRNLVEPILAHIRADKPFLGICLGLQLLFERSHEDGVHEGLGVFAGAVVRFERPRPLKVPHMGWNQVQRQRDCPLLAGFAPDPSFYFVHSYYVVPTDPNIVAGVTDYGGTFTSVVWHRNVFAVQFHPEKSQRNGLALLRQFMGL